MYLRFILTNALLMSSLMGGLAGAAEEPAFIRFSDEQRLKTSLQWLGLRPGVIRPSTLPAAAIENSTAPSSKAEGLQVGKLTDFPAAMLGKLLFVKPSGDTGSCTATFVAGNNVLLTAASCIADKQTGVNRDFVFLTSQGTEAQTMYDITCIALPAEWGKTQGPAAWRHNYAFLRTGRNSMFGGLGMTNALIPKKLSQVGFADSIGEGVQIQGVDSTAYMTRDGLIGTSYTALGSGSMGNPWVRNSIIHSLTSHFDPSQPNVLLGPRFTSDTMKLLSRARKEC